MSPCEPLIAMSVKAKQKIFIINVPKRVFINESFKPKLSCGVHKVIEEKFTDSVQFKKTAKQT